MRISFIAPVFEQQATTDGVRAVSVVVGLRPGPD
jgi:hypothetical protein